MINVLPRVPAMARESTAWGTKREVSRRSSSVIPGITLSSISLVASGVTSRWLNPVPPVLRMRFGALSRCVHSFRVSLIRSASSGTTAVPTTSTAYAFVAVAYDVTVF